MGSTIVNQRDDRDIGAVIKPTPLRPFSRLKEGYYPCELAGEHLIGRLLVFRQRGGPDDVHLIEQAEEEVLEQPDDAPHDQPYPYS